MLSDDNGMPVVVPTCVMCGSLLEGGAPSRFAQCCNCDPGSPYRPITEDEMNGRLLEAMRRDASLDLRGLSASVGRVVMFVVVFFPLWLISLLIVCVGFIFCLLGSGIVRVSMGFLWAGRMCYVAGCRAGGFTVPEFMRKGL